MGSPSVSEAVRRVMFVGAHPDDIELAAVMIAPMNQSVIRQWKA